MTDLPTRARGLAHHAIVLVLLLGVAGIALTWAWNAVAVELFDAPSARFRHALALEAALLALAALPLWLRRMVRPS